MAEVRILELDPNDIICLSVQNDHSDVSKKKIDSHRKQLEAKLGLPNKIVILNGYDIFVLKSK